MFSYIDKQGRSMIRYCLKCGKVLKNYWAANEVVGKAELWCGDCGTGHKIENCVLVAVAMNEFTKKGRYWDWVLYRIPKGTMVVNGGILE